MKTISINGRAVEVSEPYAEGQTITAIEAKVLNQTRAENIGNNFRKQFKDAGEDEAKIAEALEALRTYDKEYKFSAGGVARAPVDPVEREAMKIAREAIKSALAEKGKKMKDVDQEKLAELIERTATQEDVLKLARKRVADMKKTTGIDLGDLGLGSGEGAAA